ncbi:MAG: PIG-L deacetylase family protein [Candidatus Woesearchaeota archaeon]
MVNKLNNLIISAHPDDEIIGCGGIIAKFNRENQETESYILTYGELGNPWLKKDVIKEKRVKESRNASEILGGKVKFLDYYEKEINDNLKSEELRNEIKERIKEIIKIKKPNRIFTHLSNDPHKIHKYLNQITIDAAKELNYEGNIYGYQVWNILPLRLKDEIKIYFDISNYIGDKIKALKQFKSQKISIYQLTPIVLIRSKFAGWANNYLFAEEFILIY